MFFILLSTIALAVLGGTATASAQTTTVVKFDIPKNSGMSRVLSGITAKNLGTGEVVRPLVDPPPNCDYSDISGSVTGYYTNGVLTSTETSYSSSVQCVPAVSGQTMEYLSDIAHLYLDSNDVDQGTLGECSYPADPICTLAQSVGYYLCAGDLNCSGVYQAAHYVDMLLPDGWQWGTPVTENCSLFSPRELMCYQFTGTVVVPPVM